jgi:hypothetical protein
MAQNPRRGNRGPPLADRFWLVARRKKLIVHSLWLIEKCRYLLVFLLQFLARRNAQGEGDEKSDKNENVRILRIVAPVVSAGRTVVAAVAERQFGARVPHVSSVLPEMLQNPQMQIHQMLKMLKMLQLLQLQIRDSCNNNGLRYLQAIGCEGARQVAADAIFGVPTRP